MYIKLSIRKKKLIIENFIKEGVIYPPFYIYYYKIQIKSKGAPL